MPGKPENWKDWSGQKFGALTIIRKSKIRDNHSTAFLWEAKCSNCGGTVLGRPHRILNGYTKCLCAPRAKRNIDRTNQKVGMITMLKKTKNKSHSSYLWKCRCDCQKIIFRTYQHLMVLAIPANCGCLRKAKQNVIYL